MTTPAQSLALFGRETRYVSSLYLRRAIMFCAIALSIVLALDVAANMGRVLTLNEGSSEINGLQALAGYILLRAAFVAPSIFPIAAIMGVIWAEYGLTRSYERTMVFNGGRAPVRSLIPAVLIGLLIGATQFVVLNVARPYSTEVQAVNKYRYYGPRYVGPVTRGDKWFVSDRDVINAEIAFGPPVALRDVVLYGITPTGELESIVHAARATPADGGGWSFADGTIWSYGVSAESAGPGGASEHSFETLRLPVTLDPLWADYVDVKPRLLPMRVLHGLATADSGVPDSTLYETAYHRRYAAIPNSVAMAVLGASLALVLFSPHMSVIRLLQIVLVGYGVHVASTTLRLLGENGYLPVLVSVWTVPLAVIAASFLALYIYDRRAQASLAPPPGGSNPAFV